MGLQITSTAVGGLLMQAGTALLPKTANQTNQWPEWLNQIPGIDQVLVVFAVIAMAIAAVAKLTGNLDKIFSFVAKYWSRTPTELSERQLRARRKDLLRQMETKVAKRLKDTLHNLPMHKPVRVDLERDEQPHQVGERQQADLLVERKKKRRSYITDYINQIPGKGLIQRTWISGKNSKGVDKPISPNEETYSIFCRTDIGGRLLILGEPGAGKTTELLTVAESLVEKAIEDSEEPIPLIFELSNWKPNTPILNWLEQQLKTSYRVHPKLAKPLVQRWIQEESQLLLLLDGLDELGRDDRIECIKALEDFLDDYRALRTIICCRREEYEQCRKQLKQLNGAILLQPVNKPQIRQYLKDLGREPLWESIEASPELFNLAQLPLFLTMLVIAYKGKPIQDKPSLFNAFITTQLDSPESQGTYKLGKEKSPQETLRYLRWLAKQLKARDKTEFLIEDLQPDWLTSTKQKNTYTILVLASGPLFGCLIAVLGWKINSLQDGLLMGTMYGLFCMVCLIDNRIKPVQSFRWSMTDNVSGIRWFPPLLFGIVGWLIRTEVGEGPLNGPVTGLVSGCVAWILGGFGEASIEDIKVPNQGIKNSLRYTLIAGLAIGFFAGMSFWLHSGWAAGLFAALLFGVYGGLLVGLLGGFLVTMSGGWFGQPGGALISAIQHLSLRIALTQSGCAPWNYEQFLRHTARQKFIQITGGRYRFIHDLLREHFAQMTQQQQAELVQLSKESGQQL